MEITKTVATKPQDFIERSTADFTPGVDIATVPQNQDPKTLLFGQPAVPDTDTEPQDDTFKWDGEKNEFYVEVPNGGRLERFAGKTRTEVTKNLVAGKASLNETLAETRKNARSITPDTKLPYDPIQRRQARQLNQQEVYQINELQQTDPVKAQEMAFQARTGYTFEEMAKLGEIAEQNRRELYAAQVASDFVGAHRKDFDPIPSNMALVEGWLRDRQLPVTRNNLEIAFNDLRESSKITAPVQASPKNEQPPQEFTPPPPPVSPPSRPPQGASTVQGSSLSREEVAVIQSGSLNDARSAIQNAFRRNRVGG